MSDTPETDAQEKEFLPMNMVRSRFARKLERERNEAQDKLEVMTAKALGWQNQAELNARLLVECREKAERYRLEANAMMAQRDEANRKVAELQAGLDDIEEYGTEEINAAVDLRHQLAAALVERDELKSEKEANHQCLLMLERDIYKAREERDEIAALVRRLFQLLETVEVSDSEREFHPTYISSCRVMHTMELDELLPKLKEAAK